MAEEINRSREAIEEMIASWDPYQERDYPPEMVFVDLPTDEDKTEMHLYLLKEDSCRYEDGGKVEEPIEKLPRRIYKIQPEKGGQLEIGVFNRSDKLGKYVFTGRLPTRKEVAELKRELIKILEPDEEMPEGWPTRPADDRQETEEEDEAVDSEIARNIYRIMLWATANRVAPEKAYEYGEALRRKHEGEEVDIELLEEEICQFVNKNASLTGESSYQLQEEADELALISDPELRRERMQAAIGWSW